MAAALFAEPDLLLLDEPTNYLDLEGALWLEARLRKYPHTALVISHDRELLDHSVDGILHLTEGKLDLYTGGFSQLRAAAGRAAAPAGAPCGPRSRRKRAHMQSFVDRFRAKATKARQAQSRLKMIAKLEDVAPVGRRATSRRSSCPRPSGRWPPPLVRLEGVVGRLWRPAGPAAAEPAPRSRRPHRPAGRQRRRASRTFARLIAGALPTGGGHVTATGA